MSNDPRDEIKTMDETSWRELMELSYSNERLDKLLFYRREHEGNNEWVYGMYFEKFLAPDAIFFALHKILDLEIEVEALKMKLAEVSGDKNVGST